MSVHLPDHTLLLRLIRLAEAIVSRPQSAFGLLIELSEIEDDLVAAMRCPSPPALIGPAEGILYGALRHIASAHLSQVDAYRFALIAQHALPMVRDHLFAIVTAKARRR